LASQPGWAWERGSRTRRVGSITSINDVWNADFVLTDLEGMYVLGLGCMPLSTHKSDVSRYLEPSNGYQTSWNIPYTGGYR